MKILFIVPHDRFHYDSLTVRDKPCGGTERAATFLGEALRELGHEVQWVTRPDACDRMDALWPDVVVTQLAELFNRFPARARKVWWVHQFTDRPFVWHHAKHARSLADDVVTLSLAQQREFQKQLGMESAVIGYGVWHKEVQHADKDPAKLIYCSVPQRGLELVPELFRTIRKEEPEAHITICSSLATWGLPEEDKQFQGLFDELAVMDGVTLRGSLCQHDLWKELATASVFFYPCIYKETYCMAMDEAMAHGCVPVIPDIGALPERWLPTVRLARAAVEEIRIARQRRTPVPRPLDWSMIAEKWHRLITW
jgi:glycosyltransferase involved in cell wall biosynthesis